MYKTELLPEVSKPKAVCTLEVVPGVIVARAGETVHLTIKMFVRKPITMRTIHWQFYGTEKVSRKKQNFEREFHSCHGMLLPLPKKSHQYYRLKVGRHYWKVSLSVPNDIPSYFAVEGMPQASIRYFFRVYTERPFDSDYQVKVPVTIISPPPTCPNRHLSLPGEYSSLEVDLPSSDMPPIPESKMFLHKSALFSVKWIPNTNWHYCAPFIPGSCQKQPPLNQPENEAGTPFIEQTETGFIRGRLSIETKWDGRDSKECSHKVLLEEIHITLSSYTQFFDSDKKVKTHHHLLFMTQTLTNPILMGQEHRFAFSIAIPENLPPSINSSSLFSHNYVLKFHFGRHKLRVPLFFTNDRTWM